MKKR
jgi:hypothetical protein